MQTKTEKINKLFQICKQNPEGFTFGYKSLKPYSLKNGFAIGITNISGKNLKLLCKKVLYIAGAFKQIENKLFVGGWFNSENKRFYLDLSLIESNKNKALYLKSLFNQISIFDFKTFSCL